MVDEAYVVDPELLESARSLVSALEAADQSEVEKHLGAITHLHESDLFNELGKLTREFHEAINKFRCDERFAELTEEDIPDAKERLNYVISRTEDAANRTLTAVEASIPLCDEMGEKASKLLEEWLRFKRKEMSVEEFRVLAKEIDQYLASNEIKTKEIKTQLTEVLMAQDFQDITGQIIRRVINLVGEVEMNLVNLIKLGHKGAAGAQTTAKKEERSDAGSSLDGPQVPGLESKDVVSGQDEVDDLLSSLGF
jgi:chemotaxis protein CheZ